MTPERSPVAVTVIVCTPTKEFSSVSQANLLSSTIVKKDSVGSCVIEYVIGHNESLVTKSGAVYSPFDSPTL